MKTAAPRDEKGIPFASVQTSTVLDSFLELLLWERLMLIECDISAHWNADVEAAMTIVVQMQMQMLVPRKACGTRQNLSYASTMTSSAFDTFL
jgi:hypothetical protein